MTYARRRDSTHQDVVTTLRQIGAVVVDLANLGRDVPDVLAYFRGRTWLLEIKSPRGKLTPGQSDWMAHWPGHCAVVRSAEDAIRVVTGGR